MLGGWGGGFELTFELYSSGGWGWRGSYTCRLLVSKSVATGAKILLNGVFPASMAYMQQLCLFLSSMVCKHSGKHSSGCS